MRICFPTYLLEILNQLLTSGVDEKSMLTSMISQPGVHAVHAILDQGIRTRHMERDVKAIAIAAEERLNDLPIRARRRSVALLRSGIAVYLDSQPRSRAPLFGSTQELFASCQRV